jgi:hypothetical protein
MGGPGGRGAGVGGGRVRKGLNGRGSALLAAVVESACICLVGVLTLSLTHPYPPLQPGQLPGQRAAGARHPGGADPGEAEHRARGGRGPGRECTRCSPLAVRRPLRPSLWAKPTNRPTDPTQPTNQPNQPPLPQHCPEAEGLAALDFARERVLETLRAQTAREASKARGLSEEERAARAEEQYAQLVEDLTVSQGLLGRPGRGGQAGARSDCKPPRSGRCLKTHPCPLTLSSVPQHKHAQHARTRPPARPPPRSTPAPSPTCTRPSSAP